MGYVMFKSLETAYIRLAERLKPVRLIHSVGLPEHYQCLLEAADCLIKSGLFQIEMLRQMNAEKRLDVEFKGMMRWRLETSRKCIAENLIFLEELDPREYGYYKGKPFKITRKGDVVFPEGPPNDDDGI